MTTEQDKAECAACDGTGDMFGGFACDQCGGSGKVAPQPPVAAGTLTDEKTQAHKDREAFAAWLGEPLPIGSPVRRMVIEGQWFAWQAALAWSRRSRKDAPATACIWDSAIEAAALLVQPIPHVDEERTCGEVAEAIRKLRGRFPSVAAAPVAACTPDYLREIYIYLASVGPRGFADEAFRNVPDSVLPYSVRAEILPPYEAPQA